MHESQPKFKNVPKKYQPKGLTVLYDDKDIIVVHKENGLLTMASENEKEKTAYFLMNEYVKKGIRNLANVFLLCTD